MVTLGTNRFQSLHVSLLRRVRNTRAAGAEIRVDAYVVKVAELAGMSGVPSLRGGVEAMVAAVGE